MRKIIIVLVFSLLNFFGFAQNTEWLVSSSKITFKIKNAGFTVDGDLSGLKAKINFDATKFYGNSIEATVEAKTISTGNSARNGHLKKDDYFGVEKFPKVSMVGSTFARQVDGSYKGYFKLTIKNVVKDVVIPFTFVEKDGKANFKGTFAINRLDYGVGESSMILSNTVTVTMDVNVLKK